MLTLSQLTFIIIKRLRSAIQCGFTRPDPDVLAREFVEELEAALEQFAGIAKELGGED